MINLYDIAYSAGILVSIPFWAIKKKSREKVLTALGQRMGQTFPREGNNRAVWIHAVSLGEINAARELIAQLQTQQPNLDVIVSTTTTTGYERGRQLYGGKVNIKLVLYPLDFTPAVNQMLDATDPTLVVLMEGEMWPNFLRQCEWRKIPVVLLNGRVSESAFARYRWIRFITAKMLRRIETVCAQDQVYADRFKTLGASADRIRVTGTMKFDTAHVADAVSGDRQLALDLGLHAKHARDTGPWPVMENASLQDHGPETGVTMTPLWVCGSTGPGEETLLLAAYQKLLGEFPTLRLVIVPRKPERFDEVAKLITAAGFDLVRRSAATPGNGNPVILGDTMGELRKFYSLADVVFVGRSLVNLGSRQWGSDMIEPAALAKPVAIGPWTHNFAQPVRSFKSANAMVEVAGVNALVEVIAKWLRDPAEANALGKRAQETVRVNQGATARHVEIILKRLPQHRRPTDENSS